MLPLWFLLSIGPAPAAPVFTPAPLVRTLSVVNAGSEPVYALRVGHHANGEWSPDLLSPTQIIDVGDARAIRVPLEQTCWYDIRAEYRDGHEEELHDLDLCTRGRQLFLKH